MTSTIRIDEEVYRALQSRAVPFQDTPNSVLRRLLDLPSLGTESEEDSEEKTESKPPPNFAKRPSRPRKKGKRKRAPKGSLLPESEYELPILQIILGAGGSAPASEVVVALGDALDGRLKDLDREMLASNRIRWQSRAQFVRLKLTEKGDMSKDSPRGIWTISEQGRKRLERQK